MKKTSEIIILICHSSHVFPDHNYSAILRTAEALGIQTVYMIDPPDIVFTEDGIEGSTKGTQKQITRTPEEIEQRRLHHLFAQNAVRDKSLVVPFLSFSCFSNLL